MTLRDNRVNIASLPRTRQHILGEYERYLEELCNIRTRTEHADFWLVRRGSIETVGTPTREYNPEPIAVTVTQTEVLSEAYWFYWFKHLHSTGAWKARANGSTNLVNIKVVDVRKIRIG